MSTKLAIAGRPLIDIKDESITLGSDPVCTVTFPESSGVKPKHAVIRMIAGRWLIEVREAEAVFLNDGEPKRMVWLGPGTVFRLTENGPSITFQPIDGELLPLTTRRVSDDDDVVLPPDSSPSFPVAKPVKPPSSASIKVPKSSSSATIPTTKAPSSATIRAVRRSENSQSPIKQSRSNSHIPATGEKLKRSSSPIPVPKPDVDEPDVNAPTLQRMSSWDDLPQSGSGGGGGGGFSDEQAEMRWIMMVIGRSVGTGLVVLVIWIGISWIIKSLKPAQFDLPPTSSTAVEPTVAPVRSPQPPPTVKPAVETPRPMPNQTAKPNPPKVKVVDPPETVMVEESTESKTSDPDSMPERAKPPQKTAPKNDEPDEPDATDKAELKLASATLEAVQESIYAVVMEDSDKSRRIQVGTAWAVSKRYLVTSAAVVRAIEEHQQDGFIASVAHFANGKTFRVKSVRLHESYRKATDSAEEAKEKKDDGRLIKDRATQIRYDLGVLDVGRTERLPTRLSLFAEPLDESKESVFTVVGLPYQEKNDSESVALDPNSLKERRCKKPPEGLAPQNKEMEMTIQFALDPTGRNWSGSPVLNKSNKVIGVYSQLPPVKSAGGKPIKAENGVAWIGRLQEFAPDAE